MLRRPKFAIYPGDYYRGAISGCSLSAQGLFLRMKMVAHDSERYGYLSIDGRPTPDETIARKCGCDLSQYADLISELDRAKVMRRSATGIIFFEELLEECSRLDRQKDDTAKSRKVKSKCKDLVSVDVRVVSDSDQDNDFGVDSKAVNQNLGLKTEEEVFLVERFDQAPHGFDSSALAVGLIDKLSMTSTRANVGVVSAAIDLASRELKLNLARATDWHLKQARGHIAEGSKVDRFYFEDGMRRWTASLKRISEGIGRAEPEPVGEPDPECKKCGGTGVWMHGAHKREVICHCRTMKVSVS